jgi:hypothetical protein
VPAGSTLAVAVVSGSGARSELAGASITVDQTAGTVSTSIQHFTDYQVVAVKPSSGGCHANTDCAAGQACVSGVCISSTDGGTDGGHSDGGLPDAVLRDGSSDAAPDGGVDALPIDGGGLDQAPASCKTNADCPYPLYCIAGTCQ